MRLTDLEEFGTGLMKLPVRYGNPWGSEQGSELHEVAEDEAKAIADSKGVVHKTLRVSYRPETPPSEWKQLRREARLAPQSLLNESRVITILLSQPALLFHTVTRYLIFLRDTPPRGWG